MSGIFSGVLSSGALAAAERSEGERSEPQRSGAAAKAFAGSVRSRLRTPKWFAQPNGALPPLSTNNAS